MGRASHGLSPTVWNALPFYLRCIGIMHMRDPEYKSPGRTGTLSHTRLHASSCEPIVCFCVLVQRIILFSTLYYTFVLSSSPRFNPPSPLLRNARLAYWSHSFASSNFNFILSSCPSASWIPLYWTIWKPNWFRYP